MACNKPKLAHLNSYHTFDEDTGEVIIKRSISFQGPKQLPNLVGPDFKASPISSTEIHVECGKCLKCASSRSSKWAFRMMLEASQYEHNCFLTLTFDNEHLFKRDNPHSLNLEEIQRFNKRVNFELKKIFGPDHKYKFYYAGEYGDIKNTHRPHYHIIMMGADFPDKQSSGTNKHGEDTFTSETLSKLWPYGRIDLQEIAYGKVRYVSDYLQKHKRDNKPTIIHKEDDKKKYYFRQKIDGKIYHLIKPFAHMSNGIGLTFAKKFPTDLLKGFLTQNGHDHAIPRYFLDQLEKQYPNEIEALRETRISKLKQTDKTTDKMTFKGLARSEKHMQAKYDKHALDKTTRSLKS